MTLPPPLAQAPLLRLWDVLPDARVVGGAVRDELAGRPIADIDLATPLPPEQVTHALAAARIRVIPTGLAHGTVTALVDGQPFEITTLRRDVTTDGRHAVVAFTDDWEADAARRDFTINAMSMDRAGKRHDFFGGAADLAAGRVRFVGDKPSDRIKEDYLRVLRFFRFFGRYGVGDPDTTTSEALRDARDKLAALSAERVWAEIQRILVTPRVVDTVELMSRLGILERVVPLPLDLGRFAALIRSGLPPDPLLRLAALSRAPSGAFVPTYRISSAEKERLQGIEGPEPPASASDATLRCWLDEIGRQALSDRAWLHGHGEIFRARVAGLLDPVFPVQGRDLVALGMAPGREVGHRLADLRRLWRDGGCVASREDLLSQLVRPASG